LDVDLTRVYQELVRGCCDSAAVATLVMLLRQTYDIAAAAKY
jgi:hypothetical protein